MKTNISEKIEERVREFEEKYKGILPPEVIGAGADWYRQSFIDIAKEVFDSLGEHIKSRIGILRQLLNEERLAPEKRIDNEYIEKVLEI